MSCHRVADYLRWLASFLLGFEEAADAVEGAGFAEDYQALGERRAGGAAGEDGAQEHEVFFDAPLLGFAEGFERGLDGGGVPGGGFERDELLGGEGYGLFEGALLGEPDGFGGEMLSEKKKLVMSPNWPRVSMRAWTSGAMART